MTAIGYGINGLGYSPFGNWGLGATGTYSSYLNPMMSMNGSIMGMNGMYSMYNPMFMAKWQQDYEASQLNHMARMQAGVLDNEVKAYQNTDSALVQKMLTNADVQLGLSNLHRKVVEGDQDGICEEYDKLKSYILNTYRDEFAAKGTKINPSVSAGQYIELLYSNIAGPNANLTNDIRRYGDNAFQNGFLTGFRSGHHEKYTDETLNYIYGTNIDQKESKEIRRGIGNAAGSVASVVEKGAIGAVGAVGVTGLGLGLAKLVQGGIQSARGKKAIDTATGKTIKKAAAKNNPSVKWIPHRTFKWTKAMGKAWKPAALIGLGVGIVADILWKCNDKN